MLARPETTKFRAETAEYDSGIFAFKVSLQSEAAPALHYPNIQLAMSHDIHFPHTPLDEWTSARLQPSRQSTGMIVSDSLMGQRIITLVFWNVLDHSELSLRYWTLKFTIEETKLQKLCG